MPKVPWGGMATREEHPAVLLLPRQRPALWKNVLHQSRENTAQPHGPRPHPGDIPAGRADGWSWQDLHTMTEAGAALLSPVGFGAAEQFPGAGGFRRCPPQAGPAQPEPVTNTSWFAARLPGAGASFWKADSPQHLPPLPLQLPDKNFPFSHCFNCPHLRKLL